VATSRYQEIADELSHQIHSGELGPGDQLPTEQELQRRFEVSLNTVRSAIRVLITEGRVEDRGRQGRFVRDLRTFHYNAQIYTSDPNYFEERTPRTDSWTRQVVDAGRRTEQDFHVSFQPPDPSVASRLRIPRQELVCVRDCHRYLDGTPWCDEITYYPRDIAEQCGLDSPNDITEGTVRRLAERGYIEDDWDDVISSRPATQHEVSDFEMGPQTPMLIHARVAYSSGRPIRLTKLIMPSDRNEIGYQLVRLAHKR
jgi:GntR family transcriptional regulator